MLALCRMACPVSVRHLTRATHARNFQASGGDDFFDTVRRRVYKRLHIIPLIPMNRIPPIQRLLLPSVFLLALTSAWEARAASDSWSTNANGAWTNPANWQGGQVPGSSAGDNADVASFTIPVTANRTVTVDSNRFIGGITFGSTSAFGYIVSGGSLVLSNGGIVQNLTNTGNHTDTLGSAVRISGDGGAAFFTASGPSASSLLNISAAVSGSSTAGNTTTLTIGGTNAGANSLAAISDGTNGGKLALVKDGPGTWGISGACSYSGGTFLKAGRLTIGTNNLLPSTTVLTLGSPGTNATFALGGGSTGRTQTIGGLVSTGLGGSIVGVSSSNLATLTVNLTNGSNLFEGRLGGFTAAQTGLNFIKNGAGTLTLRPTNTNNYIGFTTLSGGTLVFGRVGAKSTNTTVTAAAGTVVGLGVGGAGFYSETDAANLFSNTLAGFNMDAATGVGLDTSAGNFTYSASQAGIRSLTKLGVNTLTLSGANTYTGDTKVDEGSLVLDTNGSLRFVIGGSGTNNAVLGAGTAVLDGQFAFDLSAASTDTNATWTIVAGTLAESYGANFLVAGFNGAGGLWTNTTNGVHYVFAQSSGVLSVRATSGVTPYNAWVSYWQALYPGFTDTAGTGDPDGDSFNNNTEFAFDGNPAVGSPSLLTAVRSGTNVVFTYLARTNASEVTYSVQSTTNLTNSWTNAVVTTSNSANQTGINLTNIYVRREFVVPAASNRFYRLQATLAP